MHEFGKCKTCGVEMIESEAFQNVATAGVPDFHGPNERGQTMSYGKAARLVPCWKCPKCGWSVTKNSAN